MPTSILVLGAGFGGLELAARLAEEVPDLAEVTLVDQDDAFVFGFTKLDVMVGRSTLDEVRVPYRAITKPNVVFRQERVVSIDPATREVVTDRDTHRPDILVLALGASCVPARTPGFVESGFEFYSPEGAARCRDVLAGFDRGTLLIGVLGPFFKCPPAPYEAAFMLHDLFVERGVRDAIDMHVLTSLPAPIPISSETSAAILDGLAERDIAFSASSTVSHLDPATKTAHLPDGRVLPFDLFLGVPIHEAPAVVVESGLTDDGWVAVDHRTFATRFPGIHAVGDITSAPVPRAGTIAEGEAGTLADVLIAGLRGGPPAEPFAGRVTCLMEMGEAGVARVEVDFLSGAAPVARFSPPSAAHAAEKQAFRSTRLARWFGIG